RDTALVAQLDEVRTLERGLAEQHAVVGHDAHRVTVDVGEAGDQGGAVAGLELVDLAAVDDPGDDLPRVLSGAQVGGDRTVQGGRVHGRRPGLAHLPGGRGGWRQGGDGVAQDGQGVPVVLGQVVHHPGGAGVQVAAAELFGGDVLTDRGLHQRRAAQEYGALPADDHGLV